VTLPPRLRRWTDPESSLGAVLPSWLAARALVGVSLVVAEVVADKLVPGQHLVQLDRHLLGWDAGWYEAIADHGYGHIAHEALRFFPLYPYLGRIVGIVLLGHVGAALLIIANAFALVAGILLHRLALHETGDAAFARRGAWFLALFPGAFVLAWGYSEPLLLAAAIGTFLALRNQRWWVAAALGAAAGLSRPLGILLVAPALIEVARGWRTVPGREWIARAAAVVGSLAGTGAYLLFTGLRFHDFRAPMRTQEAFRGNAVDPITRIGHGIGDLFGPQRLGDGLHLPFALAFVVLLVVVARRLPASYTVFAALGLVVALSAENLNSLERYGLNAFPLVLGLAFLTSEERVERLALTVAAGGIAALSTLALLGAYVP
jgi:hypothetical protein